MSSRLARRLLRGTLLVAITLLAPSCSETSPTSSDLPGPPVTLQMLDGDEQEGSAGTMLQDPFVVELLDARGRPVGGQTVTWTVVTGGGTLSPATSVTNAEGQARTFLRLGMAAGPQRVHATQGTLGAVEFDAMASAPPAGQVVLLSGGGQTANAGAQLPAPVVVQVVNAAGTAVVGASVTFQVTAGEGTVQPGTATTDAAGRASTSWRLGAAAGTQTMMVSATGATSTEVSATARATAQALSIVSGDGQAGTVATNLAAPLVVRLVDGEGAPVAGATITFTAASGSGTVTPATATTSAQGEASATWRLGTAAGTQTVNAQSTAGGAVTFDATARAGAAAQLSIVSGNNQVGAASQALPLPLTVQVADGHGNPVPGATVSFAVTGGGGAVTPATATTAANGRASAAWTLGATQGSHEAAAQVAGIGNALFSATATPPVHVLAHRVVDAEFNAVTNRIVTVSANPSRLHILDPETRAVQSVDLAQVPNVVAVAPDGSHAAVGHNGWVSYVNLATARVERVYAVTTDAVDVILPDNGWVYVFPRTDQWESIRSIDLATGAESNSGGWSIYAGTVARLHPSGRYMYGANNGLSPSDFEKYDIRSGTATMMYDSPYHGDYSFGGNVWISEDGLRLFARSGNVFRSSEVRAEDMLYAGALQGITLVRWVTQSSGAGRIYALSGTAAQAAELRVYDSAFLAYKGTVALPRFAVPDVGSFKGEGRFVFTNAAGSRIYVLQQAEGAAGMALDWGLVTYDRAALP